MNVRMYEGRVFSQRYTFCLSSLLSASPMPSSHQDTDGDFVRRKRVKDIMKCLISDTLDSTPFRVPPPTLSVHEVTPNLRRLSRRSSSSRAYANKQNFKRQTTHEQVTNVARYKNRKQSSLFHSIFEWYLIPVFFFLRATVFIIDDHRRVIEETKAHLFLRLSSEKLLTFR